MTRTLHHPDSGLHAACAALRDAGQHLLERAQTAHTSARFDQVFIVMLDGLRKT